MVKAEYIDYSVELLKEMIETPSVSRNEAEVASLLYDRLQTVFAPKGIKVNRLENNLWMQTETDPAKPTLLLNAHIDTVKPAAGYTREPYKATVEGDTLYGLGSNDDGGSVAALLAAFRQLIELPSIPYNLVLAFSAEEEVSGKNGIDLMKHHWPVIDFGIVGEPTGMQMATAERGLMVLDCTTKGKSGHAARKEGVNALYKALPVINWFREKQWERVSETLGPVAMQVTQINCGTQHNVVPDTCTFVADVRVNELYSNEELLELIKEEVSRIEPDCEVKARSTRLASSATPLDHKLVQKGMAMGLGTFGSATMSDQALLRFPTVKMGPGDSARSHTADEYIRISEIKQAANIYYNLIKE